MPKAADAAARAISQALADKEGREPGAVRCELLERVAVIIARSCVRAIRKRCVALPRCPVVLSAAIASSARDIADEELGGEEAA